MNSKSWIMSAESYSRSHPDKACDLISDFIVDFFVERDAKSIISVDTLLCDKLLTITGDFFANNDAVEEARAILPYGLKECISKIYPANVFDWNGAKKSLEFKPIVGNKLNTCKSSGGFVDTGLVYGYACDETEELMPMPISIANKLMKKLDECKSENKILMDHEATIQANVLYYGQVPKKLDSIVFNVQQKEGYKLDKLKDDINELVIKSSLAVHMLDGCKILTNISGDIRYGGPKDTTGISGRKLSSDSYGASCSFSSILSGRSSRCISRSGSYMARCIAKGLVLAGLTSKAKVSIAYASGRNQPVSLSIDFCDCELSEINEIEIAGGILEAFDLSAQGICEFLGLEKPIYGSLSNYGHFGVDEKYSWEGAGAKKLAEFFESLSS